MSLKRFRRYRATFLSWYRNTITQWKIYTLNTSIHYEILDLNRAKRRCYTKVLSDDNNIQRRELNEIDEQEASQYVVTLLGNVIQQ